MTNDLSEIYKYSDMNLVQVQKNFDVKPNKIFSETNSKKHFTKVLDMIKSQFYNSKTNNYVSVFLFPIKEKDEYDVRKRAFENISSVKFEDEVCAQIKSIISSIEDMDTKIVFTKTIYTLDVATQKVLYDSYKINSFQISKKELEEIMQTESNFIVISQESLYAEFETFTLEEFVKIIRGSIIKKNKKQILELVKLLDITKEFRDEILNCVEVLSGVKLDMSLDFEKLKSQLEFDSIQSLKELSSKALILEEETQNLNKELKEIIAKKQLSLQGDELLELLNSGNVTSLQEKFKVETKEVISKKERELIDIFREQKISITHIFEDASYPLKLDEEVKEEILKQIDYQVVQIEFEEYENLGEFDYKQIKNLFSYSFFFDFLFGISKFSNKYESKYPKISKDKLTLVGGRNMYIKDAMPINYGLGVSDFENAKLNSEKITILTGANSGGKTTLLEMFLQAQILTHIGLGISAEKSSEIKLFDEIIYLKKFTGTQGSGAFEQTVRNLIEIIDSDSSKLILIDEFEAITEPGAAAKILIEFLMQISNGDNFCIGVSHLGLEIKKFLLEKKISTIRIDGISATGIDEKGNLITNHQPQFNELGKSTPELILKKILQDEKFFKNKSSKSKEILKRII